MYSVPWLCRLRPRTPSSCWSPWRGSGRTSQGGRTRQIQIQSTAALLRWGVAERRMGEDWEPPQDLAVFVGRSRAAKAITSPLEVEHILGMVRAIPDPRWRFAFQLMAAYGLRPEELQHLQVRQGRLWCMYEKIASRGKTRPRVLRPLPCDDWADGWRLEERFPTQQLPPMQPGPRDLRPPPQGGGRGDGAQCQVSPPAYSRWCGDDVVDDAFAKAEQRLGQGLRAQSSAT
jgi:integrase